MFHNHELCAYLTALKYYFHIKWYNGIYGTWLSLHNLYLLALFMKYWVIDIFMILSEDCPRASFIESRYGKLYKSCIKFWSICWVHKHNTLCIHGIHILNQICIKLVNFTLKTLKISAEFKKKEIETQWNSTSSLISSIHSYNKYLLMAWCKLKASWKWSVHLK